MKKIVGAVLAATMLAGTAMADIGFSYTGTNYFTSSGGNLGYDHGARTDCLSVSLSNQYGGAVVDIDVDGGSLVQDEYYGWANWTLPVGQLQVTAGVWNGRYVNRVRADAGDLKAADFEKYKPGVINGSSGKDSDNLTEGKIGVVAAYTLTDKLPGTLMAKFGLVKSAWNPDAASAKTAKESGDVEDSDIILNSGFVGEVAYQQEDLIRANLAFKSLVKKNFSVAAFVTPLMLDKLTWTFGGTVAKVQNYAKYSGDEEKVWQKSGVEWGIDLRARYKVTDDLSITTMNNLSSYYTDNDLVPNAKATYDPVTATYSDYDTVARTEKTNTLLLWNMINATYNIADNLTVGLTFNSVCNGLTDNKAKGMDFTVSPSLVIQATEKVAVTTAFRANWANVNLAKWSDARAMNVTIPVIFSFSY